MVRGDILGGLRVALAKGDSLQKAMQSFYNSGYKKDEIEEAARFLQTQGFQPEVITKKPEISQKKQISKPSGVSYPIYAPKTPPTEPVRRPIMKQQYRPAQKQMQPMMNQQFVSHYGEKKSSFDFMTVMLLIILLVLIGLLVSVFLFKEDLIQFLNSVLE